MPDQGRSRRSQSAPVPQCPQQATRTADHLDRRRLRAVCDLTHVLARDAVAQHSRRCSARGPWFVTFSAIEKGSRQFRQATSARFDPGSFWPNATGIEGNGPAPSVIHYFHGLIWLFTKTAQSTGSENTGPERSFLGRMTPTPVNSPCRTTFEKKGIIRLQLQPETYFASVGGGAGRLMRTSLRKDNEAVPYAAQRPRHAMSAAVRFLLNWCRLERLRS